MGRKVYVTSDISSDEKLIEVAEQNSEAAILWPWFLTAFDDWGRSEASPKKLKARVFPMLPHVTPQLIEEALRLYDQVELIKVYVIDGKPYMAIPNMKTWYKWQTHIRTSKREKDESRIPPPPSDNSRKCAQVREGERICTPSPSLSPSPTPSGDKNISSPDGSGEYEITPAEKPKQGGAQTNKSGKGDEYTPEFEEFYSAYPRRVEKRRAYKAWKAQIKEKAPPENMILAAVNYAANCKNRGTEPQYIKHPATFLGKDKPYEDWLRPCTDPTGPRPPDMPKGFAGLYELMQEDDNNDPTRSH